jgi:hypothetical protein
MTEPQPLWPHPPRRRGSRIRHGWRCTRTGRIAETTRRTPDGVIVEVDICLECESTDLAERLLARLDPPPDAAA